MKYKEKPKIKDKITALVIALVILLAGAFNLDNNCDWGDDYAAYMSDGIAIARGSYDEQIHINSLLRNGISDLSDVHVHSFGLPLLHSVIYRLFGFDTVNFGNLYAYKLPSLLFFAFASGVFFLFLKSRFNLRLSVFGCIMLFSGGFFYAYIRNLGNDVLFMSLSLMCFYFGESFVSSPSRKYPKGCLLGILIWGAYSVRLNGISVLLALIILHTLELFKGKRKPTLSDICPYAVFAVLFTVINCMIFPRPTSTSSLIADFELSRLSGGIVYYSQQLYQWVNNIVDTLLTSPVRLVLNLAFPRKDPVTFYRYFNILFTSVFFVFVFIGMVFDGITKNIHITVFTVLTFLASSSLMLGQDLRYLLVILPFIVMYFCYGVKRVYSLMFSGKKFDLSGSILTAIACILLLLPMIRADIDNISNPSRELLTAYSDGAVDVYNYINTNLDEDTTIAFFKPRALYLNTGRISLLPGKNDTKITSADYYLYYKPDPEFIITDELRESYVLEYENTEFSLYRLCK